LTTGWDKTIAGYSQTLKRDVTVEDVIRAVESGDPAGILDRMDWTAASNLFVVESASLMAQALERAGKLELEHMRLTMKFDLQNPYVYQWIDTHTAELVVQIGDETRKAIKSVIRNAFETGVHPYQSAKAIKEMVGLTERDANTALKYWKTVAMDGTRSVSAANKMAETYEKKLLRRRAENIARTETINAASRGSQYAWEEARAEGLLLSMSMQEWIAAVDSPRTCPRCLAMDGQKVPIGEPFQSDAGLISGPTLHPSCRCAVALVTEIPK